MPAVVQVPLPGVHLNAPDKRWTAERHRRQDTRRSPSLQFTVPITIAAAPPFAPVTAEPLAPNEEAEACSLELARQAAAEARLSVLLALAIQMLSSL